MLARALPTPDSTSTLPNTPPAPVTKITTAAVGRAEPIMSLVCCKLQPRRKANNQNASTSAIIRATIGEPINCSVPSRGCEGGISVAETVPAMIIAIGITISEVTNATPGGFILSLNFVAPSSLAGASCICSSTSTDIAYWRLLIIFAAK
ncbi:hypothetical protein HmCmsJML025_00366 [Escherichia coli]|nr:hypothetical protein HmCmsJML025_00366 [Escherichia coli]